MPPIRTTLIYPPIPDRRWDYQATFADDEPDDDGRMRAGFGRIEAEAVADLVQQMDEE